MAKAKISGKVAAELRDYAQQIRQRRILICSGGLDCPYVERNTVRSSGIAIGWVKKF
jgi:hypothetical protein